MIRRIPQAFLSASRLLRLLAILALVAGLPGCGSGTAGGGATAGSSSTGSTGTASNLPAITQDVTISGSVGDGPVTGATVTVLDASGAVLGTVVSDSGAGFRKTLKVKGNQYPLQLVASGGTDLVTGHAPDFKLVSVMLSPSDKVVNINPFSTLIVNTALRMPGGVTATNVTRARTAVLDKLGFGLDTATVPDPITTPVTGSNAANIVKASEALGELVRRSRDLIAATGRSASGSSVVLALSADLVDGFVDGLGAGGTDATVSAVANVVSAQVLVEAMSNNLRVGGIIATKVIDQAIRSTHPGVADSQLSGSVLINSQMIRQAGVAMTGVQVLDAGTAVQDIAGKIAGLNAGSTSGSVATVLPAGSSGALDSATGLVATASDADITQINQIAFAQTDTGATSTSSGGSTGSTGTSGGSTGSTSTTGGFTVSWTAPTTRSDGTPLSLSAIGGFRIYYGSQHGSYPNSVNITDGTARTATVNNLASGTYYLVMTTYDSAGIESRYSTEAVKNVP